MISMSKGGNHKSGATTNYVAQIFPKAAWKWKNIEPRGGGVPGAPLGSANDLQDEKYALVRP